MVPFSQRQLVTALSVSQNLRGVASPDRLLKRQPTPSSDQPGSLTGPAPGNCPPTIKTMTSLTLTKLC
jgi:hypothetical protein